MTEILKKFDKQIKKRRFQLISNNYSDIVAKSIHYEFDRVIVIPLKLQKVKEIVYFSYKSNVYEIGDQFIDIHYMDKHNNFQQLSFSLYEKNKSRESILVVNNITYKMKNLEIDLVEFETLLSLMLCIFHRNYQKRLECDYDSTKAA